MKRLALIALLSVFSFSVFADVQPVAGEWAWIPDTLSQATEPPLWDKLKQLAPNPLVTIDTIERSAPDELEGVRAWNKRGLAPPKNGISHKLLSPVDVSFNPDTASVEGVTESMKENQLGRIMQTADGDLLWSSSVLVKNSYRLRLHLKAVDLPKHVKMWVYSDSGEFVGPFGSELADDDGSLWTPSVAGPSVKLVVLIPDKNTSAHFTISKVLELFRLDSNGQPILNQTEAPDLSCLKDAQCFTSETYERIDETKRAVAQIHFIKGDSSFMCSGGLVNDKVVDTYVPYFLTANHCISTQAAASSLEAYWDFKSTTCGGAEPGLGSVPRTNGATLLVTGTVGDFTLLQLSNLPAGRWLLGWEPNRSAIGPGTVLHNISHPKGMGAHYSQTTIDDGNYWCAGWPRDSFIYKFQTVGGTAGGSSGAPTLLSNGRIVGQFVGWCGENQDERCDYSNHIVDGSLSAYFASVAPYINSETPPANLPTIGPEHSGAWHYSAQSGHGFSIVVGKKGDGTPLVLMYWYTYDTKGLPVFLIGTGVPDGNRVEMTFNAHYGMKFGEFDPTTVERPDAGVAIFTFQDDISGTFEYLPSAWTIENYGHSNIEIPITKLFDVSHPDPEESSFVLEVEPNDQSELATGFQLGDTVKGSLSDIGDVDWFAVEIDSQHTGIMVADFDVSSMSIGVWSVYWYDPGMNIMSGRNLSAPEGFQYQFPAFQPGTYYLRIAYDEKATFLYNGGLYAVTLTEAP